MTEENRLDSNKVPYNMEAEAEIAAGEWFATAPPHEAYETWPERFWKFFHGKHPTATKNQMISLLAETEWEPEPDGNMGQMEHDDKGDN